MSISSSGSVAWSVFSLFANKKGMYKKEDSVEIHERKLAENFVRSLEWLLEKIDLRLPLIMNLIE